MSVETILDDLASARTEFFGVLDGVHPAEQDRPGLAGEWGARELVAHLGYWAGRAVDVMRAVEEGRADEVNAGQPPVDEVNATVARVARASDLATVRKREAASVEALVEQLRRIDPGLMAAALPSGAPLARVVLEDGPEHYREHAEALRRTLEGGSA